MSSPHKPVARLDAAGRRYLPDTGRDWLLPLYGPFTRLIGVESAHRKLADQAELESAERVLEIGCGTGNLALLVKRMCPQLAVVRLGPIAKRSPPDRLGCRRCSCCDRHLSGPAALHPRKSLEGHADVEHRDARAGREQQPCQHESSHGQPGEQ